MSKKFSDYLAVLSEFLLDYGGDLQRDIVAACADSRQCHAGSLFCAMQGQAFDGHEFIESALHSGAVALISERPVSLPEGTPWALVQNPYAAFARIAELSADYPAKSLKLLAVTGTNGKTTTAYLLRHIFKTAGFRVGMLGTVEYDLGSSLIPADRTTPTPFELQKLLAQMRDNRLEYAVLELSSHALEQERLGSAKVEGAVFTNLSQDHLDYHTDFEAYYRAKRRLFTEMLAPDMPMIVNLDDQWGKRLATDCQRQNVVTYSLKSAADLQVKDVESNLEGSSFSLQGIQHAWHLRSRLTGLFNVYNLAGAVALAQALGIDQATVQKALSDFAAVPGRMQRIASRKGPAVFVDYAHTDEALRNVLAALRPVCQGQLCLLFGCGGNRDKAKRPMMAKAAEEGADRIFLSSDNPRRECPEDIIADVMRGFAEPEKVQVIIERENAIRTAIESAQPEDIVLIAGKGHETYQEINGVKKHFDDVEIAAKYLQNLGSQTR
ncbi:MAG: UDP-N-acetylmuramoyl-L-alanyl-D-glutamate--2,6-diaminopimelate ligase [Oligosphaeraceae bacterium]|nr:UDP-N-acetylmuramoyl-L-alanyl-D-glutamate--2,6-diaminopimelate ligase [Oligosphaeraceae bacterium]